MSLNFFRPVVPRWQKKLTVSGRRPRNAQLTWRAMLISRPKVFEAPVETWGANLSSGSAESLLQEHSSPAPR
jgi:hypothetical protein